MTVQVDFFRQSGNPGTSELTTNSNFMRVPGHYSAETFYLHPIRRLEKANPTPIQYSYNNYIYVKLSGTYGTLKRPRFKVVVPSMGNNNAKTKMRFMCGLRNSYEIPKDSFDGTLMFKDAGTYYFYPSMSPDQNINAEYQGEFNNNEISYTNYLVTQLLLDTNDFEPEILPEIKIYFEIDEIFND